MRKYLAVLLGVLLILSFTVTAYAADQTAESVVSASGAKLTLGAKLVPRGWYFKNISAAEQGLPEDTQSQALYSSNVYLTVEGKIADNVTGMIELESAYGTSTTSGVYYWGTLDSKPNAQMRIRQAWIQYTGSGLLGIPTGVKVGHMPVSLGEKVFLDLTRFGTDGILLFANPVKELTLVLHTLKVREENDATFGLGAIKHSDDIDIYGILGTYALDKANTLGLHFTWVKSDWPGTDPEAVDVYNLGVHGNGKIAGFSYAAEADFQFGELTNTTVDDNDFKGWAVLAKLGYQIDPVNIRGSFAMGSGAEDADDIEEFQAVVGTDDTGAIARYTHYTLVYERCVRTAAIQQILTGAIRTTGLANTTYFNLGLDVNPLKELSISLDGYLLQATETDLWEEEVGNSVDDELGWEIDTKLTYKITKNLSYFVEAGFFKAGDFYEDAFGIDSETATMAVHGLSLAF